MKTAKLLQIIALVCAAGLLALATGCAGSSSDSNSIRLATYNVGDFSGKEFEAGSDEGNAAYQQLIAEVDADLWALQEDVQYVDEETQMDPHEAIYAAYENYERRGTGKFNYKAFLSDLEIRDADYFYYEGLHPLGHKMFMRATVTLAGKDICLINVHLDWEDPDVRSGQIQQVLAYAKQFEYVIIMGDFNHDDITEEVKAFTDAGYTSANAGEFGVISTYVNGGGSAIDNILVSNNIRIVNAGNVKADWMNDHTPFWADIVIE